MAKRKRVRREPLLRYMLRKRSLLEFRTAGFNVAISITYTDLKFDKTNNLLVWITLLFTGFFLELIIEFLRSSSR
jgi:hypothetical protein